MKKNLILFVGVIALLSLVACNKTNISLDAPATAETSANLRAALSDYDEAAQKPVVTISGNITTNTTWSAGNVYELSGIVAVTDNATLTIEAGTFIKAKYLGKEVPSGVLVVTKGAKLMAVGTAEKPIVFTSYKLLDKDSATLPETGDFGGLVLLGNATVNTPADKRSIEGIKPNSVAGADVTYGGTDDTDNSGVLEYVRIEYAGYQLSPDNEINGLTCGGVGSGTTLSHIQVSWGKDDSFEFFGGTVNADHLISYACDDDNFDFDNGYRGTIRYALALANPGSTHSVSKGKSDSNGIELDNNAKDQDEMQFALTPKTHPTLEYVTIVGASTKVQALPQDPPLIGDAYKYAARIRRGGEITIKNSIFTGYPKGIVIDSGAEGATPALSSFINCHVHGFDATFLPAPAPAGIVLGNKPNMGYSDPFYPTMNFGGSTNPNKQGAFAHSLTWHKGWTIF